VRWPGGAEHEQSVVEGPGSVFMVPVDRDLRTVLVRQWRHSWEGTSWEVPAGTLEPGEEPLEGARRELAEEAGLTAGDWTPLGAVRGSSVLAARQWLFLARDLSDVVRAPELSEADMVVRWLPLREAVEAASRGAVVHAAAVAALLRAAWLLRIAPL
jgi:ADP-ribose pyrophosphatase